MTTRVLAKLDREFVRFLLVGGLAATVNLVARYLISRYTSYEIAVALAFPFGLATGYGLSRWMVFAPSGRSLRHEMWWFLLVNLVALVQVWIISVGLVNLVFPMIGFDFHPEEVAHFIGVSAPVVTSYFGHKWLTFRSAN